MNKVYVVQPVMKRNSKGILEPKFNFSAACDFGQLEILLSQNCKPFDPDSVLPELRIKLRNYGSTDWILCVGSPILIGWACAVAANVNYGELGILQWNGSTESYQPVRCNIIAPAGNVQPH